MQPLDCGLDKWPKIHLPNRFGISNFKVPYYFSKQTLHVTIIGAYCSNMWQSHLYQPVIAQFFKAIHEDI